MAPPVGFTQALPRLHTGAMNTARMGDALVAVLTLPAIQTAVTHTQNHAIRQNRDIDPPTMHTNSPEVQQLQKQVV